MRKKLTKEQKKDAIVTALLDKKISSKQAIAQLQDIGWGYEEAEIYVGDLLGEDNWF